jgi:tryptophan synthase alpha subunit
MSDKQTPSRSPTTPPVHDMIDDANPMLCMVYAQNVYQQMAREFLEGAKNAGIVESKAEQETG